MENKSGKGAAPVRRDKEKKLQEEGLKPKHTHPKNEEPKKDNEDPNGMTAKTLEEMKKKLHEAPKKSAATEHDKKAYE